MNMRLVKLNFTLLIALAIFINSCKSDKKKIQDLKNDKQTLFTLTSPKETGIDFVNKVVNNKDFNIFKYRNFYNGGGVAIGDVNNDGLPDIYLTANMEGNKLFLNKGDFKFEDISESAGVVGNKPWSTGVVMVDINQDGFLDIYVSNAGNVGDNNQDNDLYINNGDLTFTQKAEEYNLAKTGFSIHASFFDYDKDGDLDAYILNNSNIPVSSLGYAEQRDKRAQDWENVPEIFRGVGDMLLRNDNGKFVDVSEEAGIYGSLIGFGLGVMVSDVNGDLYPDIYVTNDFYERDYLYINNQDGTFNEEIKNWTSHLSLSAMGVDMADINNDGNIDIFVTDMLPEGDQRVKSMTEFEGYNIFKLKQSKDFHQQYIQNTLQLNNGNNTFSEIAYFSGVAKTDWSWGTLLFDMDNDGFRDIFITNGINHDLTDLDFMDFFANDIIQNMALTGKKEAIDSIINKMPVKPQPNYVYRNNRNIKFSNANKEWGFETPTLSNGVAYGDLDNDGDLDLVINNVNMDAYVYKNNSETLSNNHYIQIKLKGSEANPFAIGSTIKLYYDNNIVIQEQMPSRGFQSSVDYTMTIGLGDAENIDSLRVVWPNDKTQKIENVKANQVLTLNLTDANGIQKPFKKNKIKTLVTELSNDKFTAHKENTYSDFDHEGLIPKMLSQEGPALAVGDVNNDGNEDFFIGGAKNQQGVLYINMGKGNVKPSQQKVFIDDANLEDTAATFFDADNDGDLDLMVGSGGNEVGEENNYKPRLYLNNGKGDFSLSANYLPKTNKNISVITTNDFDNDGDIDVFIGSRSVVGTYGISPNHLFLENNGDGTFTDATERLAYDLKDAGMVTNAIWADVNGDNKKDLITVSEWGTPKIFRNTGRRLAKMDSSLDDMNGMWNVLEAADFDNDGDLDLVFGNQGDNTTYQTSKEHPMKIWINDFDNNGTIEQIVTRDFDGKDYPVHMKKELTAQMVKLKKENLKASEYAKRTINELFSKEIIESAIKKKSSITETVIAVNNGNGDFTIKILPSRVQLSCVCGITCVDINNDGNIDIVMGGNNFEFKPQYSRLDGNLGNVLINKGNFDFEWQDYNTSGFVVRDEIKHLKQFKDKDGKTYIIAAINDSKPKIFSINE
ncbi:Repeat domain-containing protein [Flaviramulus basaltis]|uniref:Repeat domain-containing protein n=1 Tax=Flaviramulus basaltis TaxID=369401 RepID=A0A1K2IJY5_9FLAO|nr:VCBS repeat-containing protein [Flaviramulus basaltis]SFZ92761.1 Repeat domain-containing protein [Flaviramulus basaltis]